MSKKGGTKVEAVDPWEVGRADATFNRIDSYTPFGNLTYSGPNRNQANLQLNPYLAGNEERRMLSDRMLLDTALGRQVDMNQGGLPSLTTGINPGAMQEFFGLPSSLQSGFDQAPTPPTPPNVIRGSDTQGGKGGQLPGPPPGGPTTPGQKGGGGYGGYANPSQPQTMGGGGMWGGLRQAGQQQRAKGGSQPQMQESKVGRGVGDIGGGFGGALPNGGMPQNTQSNPLFGGTVGGQLNPLSQTEKVQDIYNRIDPNTFGQIGSLDQLQDFDMDRNRVEQSFFDRSASLLNPQYDQAEQRMVSDLRARGIPRDSEAFEREMSNFRRDKGETYSRLADQAVLSGGGEQSRLFGISSALGDRPMNATNQLFGMAGALGGMEGQAQQQLFGMADQLSQRDIQAQLQNANISSMNRATQFNELASLLGLQQVASPGLNNFFAPGNVDMTGAYGLNQQAQMANARNSASQKGGMLGGLGALGGAAIGAPSGGWFGKMLGG